MPEVIAYCPACQKKYRVDSRLLGKALKCKKCETTFAIDPPSVPSFPAEAAPPQAVPPQPTAQPVPLEYDPLNDPLSTDADVWNDPLSMPAEVQPANQGQPTAHAPSPGSRAPANAWQAAAKQASRQSVVLGGSERAMLILGGFLVLCGILLNLLPFFGTQVGGIARLGSAGPLVVMLMGLAGAGLIAAGLRAFKPAWIISGASAAALTLVVFGISLAAGDSPEDQRVADGGGAGESTSADGELVIKDAAESRWRRQYPNWEGFNSSMTTVSTASEWWRVDTSVPGISASFPGDLQSSEKEFEVDGKSVTGREMRGNIQGQRYTMTVYDNPSPGESDTAVLAAFEAALNVDRDTTLEFDSCPASEFKGRRDSYGVHGRVVNAGDYVVVVRVEGPTSLIPGDISVKFLDSLRISKKEMASIDSGSGDSMALDPFALDGDAPIQNTAPVDPSSVDRFRSGPPISLTPAERMRDSDANKYVRAIEAAMDRIIHQHCRLNFAPHYLSVSVGDNTGERRFITHPSKLPIVGFDYNAVRTGSTHAFTMLTPVYNVDDHKPAITARDGYAVSGIYVNGKTHVEGIKLVFAKITDRGFDTGQTYESEWLGTPPSGPGRLISGNGKPVYGIWMFRGQSVRSLGLIREK